MEGRVAIKQTKKQINKQQKDLQKTTGQQGTVRKKSVMARWWTSRTGYVICGAPCKIKIRAPYSKIKNFKVVEC